jgi:hypothetical protein
MRHALYGFYKCLDPNSIEIWIQVLSQATIRCSGIGRL